MHYRVLLSLIIILGLVSPSLADPGWISSSGAAHLLTENKTVSMQREIVNIVVGKNLVSVDCECFFVNRGPACSVRMGFPDRTIGQLGFLCADLRYSKDQLSRPTFLSYTSYVDGKKVSSEVEKGDEDGALWHVNVVDFPVNGERVVRDVYTVSPGLTLCSDGNSVSTISYILSTAASWLGKVERATVNITFASDILHQPLTLVPVNQLEDVWKFNWKHDSRGTILYKSSKAPSAEGDTIRIELTDIKPAEKDDIYLSFGYKNSSATKKYLHSIEKKLLGGPKGKIPPIPFR